MPPRAISQGNVVQEDVADDGFETIPLDGRMSSDPDGEISSYSWTIADTLIDNKSVFHFAFPLGTHLVQLMVTDNDGNSDHSTFTVIVADLDNHVNHRIALRQGQLSRFMSGINVAWSSPNNYAQDLLNFEESVWIKLFDEVQAAGGNAVRWWLHTNGFQTPIFDHNGLVSGMQQWRWTTSALYWIWPLKGVL